jgi:predicted AAA+ superfamily ATPase
VSRGELQYGDTTEEKLSLSERFGLRIAFHSFNQEQYLLIVDYWLRQLTGHGNAGADARQAALEWALKNGTRSGRSAWQFARAWAGRRALNEVENDRST